MLEIRKNRSEIADPTLIKTFENETNSAGVIKAARAFENMNDCSVPNIILS